MLLNRALYRSPRSSYTGENFEFENAAFFLQMSLSANLIRNANRTFRKRSFAFERKAL